MSGDVCNLNKDENATMTGQIRRKQTPSDKIENKQRRKVKQQEKRQKFSSEAKQLAICCILVLFYK